MWRGGWRERDGQQTDYLAPALPSRRWGVRRDSWVFRKAQEELLSRSDIYHCLSCAQRGPDRPETPSRIGLIALEHAERARDTRPSIILTEPRDRAASSTQSISQTGERRMREERGSGALERGGGGLERGFRVKEEREGGEIWGIVVKMERYIVKQL